MPAEPLDVESLEVSPKPLDDITLPDALLEPVTGYLTREYGCKPALARAMAEQAAQTRKWCCPRVKELRPGQAVWLVYSTHRFKRGRKRLLVPVILTLLTPEEQALNLNNRSDLKHLKIRQVERVTAEAWQQDGVLTMLDLEGLSTHQIARRIYHTPEAVDNYLRLFDRVLVLRYFGMPPRLMRQVTGHSLALVKEHLALAEKHFPTEKELVQYLTNQEVKLKKAQ